MKELSYGTKELCAQWWSNRLEIPEKREAFKLALLPKIQENANLWIDYNVRGILRDALAEIGVTLSIGAFDAKGILPLKTGMIIESGEITVKEGYGGEFVTIGYY